MHQERGWLPRLVNCEGRQSMFDPIKTNPERARVRLRDILAAWLLVALILLAGALQAAKAGAIHAACAARCEVVTVLHAVPKLLQRNPQA
jgi:hypothetical protein